MGIVKLIEFTQLLLHSIEFVLCFAHDAFHGQPSANQMYSKSIVMQYISLG